MPTCAILTESFEEFCGIQTPLNSTLILENLDVTEIGTILVSILNHWKFEDLLIVNTFNWRPYQAVWLAMIGSTVIMLSTVG